MIKNFILFVICLSSAHAGIIEEINLKGNTKTNDEIILSEIGFKVGDNVSAEDITEAKRRLLNLNLFSKVDVKIGNYRLNKRVDITIEERWTTIPFFKLASGGGVTQTTVGIFDPNIAGKYLEVGGQYERLGDTNSGVVWFKNPRLWGQRHGLDFQLWRVNRLRTKYDQSADDAIVTTGFLQTRDKYYFGYTKEFNPLLNGRLAYEYNQDEFSDKLVPAAALETVTGTTLPPNTSTHFLDAEVNYGQVNYRNHLVDGNLVGAIFKMGRVDEPADTFFQTDIFWRYYKTINEYHTFAQRVKAGGTNTELLQYWNYLGGLASIRGFADNRFAGRYFWLSNTEYRYAFYENKYAVFQWVGFLDMVNTVEVLKRLFSLKGVSTGAGFRVFLPKVYRFVLRVDYALRLKKADDNSLSFGVQQFF